MPSGSTASRRRLKRLLIASAGAAALATLSVLAAVFPRDRTTVETLVRIMTADDEADAIWAFARLEDLHESAYEPLLDYVDSDETTSLPVLSWGGARRVSQRLFDPFTVGEMARFALTTHLRIPLRHQHGLEEAWENRAVKEEEPGLPQYFSWWLSGRYRLTPPSQIASLARAVGSADVDSMLEFLKGDDRPDATWAFEVLKAFPDTAYDELIAHVGDPAPTRVTNARRLEGARLPAGGTPALPGASRTTQVYSHGGGFFFVRCRRSR